MIYDTKAVFLLHLVTNPSSTIFYHLLSFQQFFLFILKTLNLIKCAYTRVITFVITLVITRVMHTLLEYLRVVSRNFHCSILLALVESL